MPLSWNEIRHRAIAFSKQWTGVRSERGEKQTFWNEFFDVFGIRRRAVASFEEPVQKISGKYGYIDPKVRNRPAIQNAWAISTLCEIAAALANAESGTGNDADIPLHFRRK